MENIVDLDVLRPEKRLVKLGEKVIDVSFIPCGITFEIDQIVRQIQALDKKELDTLGDATKRAFDLTIQLCVTFCKWKYPEMHEAWFLENTDGAQIKLFAETIKECLIRSYAGIEAYGKNPTGDRVTGSST